MPSSKTVPYTRLQKIKRSLLHFVLGAVIGILPALLAYASISLTDDGNPEGGLCALLIGFSGGLGLVFMILGMMETGRGMNWLLRILHRYDKVRKN
jgi:uncharacterized membrane protein YdjX (TVP38/TMEM64 family)